MGASFHRCPSMPPFLRFAATATLLLATLSAHAAPEISGRRVSVQAADAQAFLEGRFPQRQEALGGLLEVTISQPRLAIPPGQRMQLGLDLALATAGGAPVPMGNMILTSALRYDTTQRAFFLDQPRIDSFQPVGGGDSLDDGSRQLLNAWLTDYARNEPVYRIDPAIAALLGGMEVESAGIEDGRLVVTFNQELGGLAPALAD
jgi:hypothetical protein